jgi:hypothetical protein
MPYRDAADAFSAKSTSETKECKRGRRRAEDRAKNPARHMTPYSGSTNGILCSAFEQMEGELDAEQRRRGALAYDQQALRARILRLETEIILIRAMGSPPA